MINCLFSSKKSGSSSSNNGENPERQEVYTLKEGRLAPPGKEQDVGSLIINHSYIHCVLVEVKTPDGSCEEMEKIEIDEFEADEDTQDNNQDS